MLTLLRKFADRIMQRRGPDQVIGGYDNPYLLRCYVIPKNRFFNVYLHRFWRSDDDRALHDHPWVNLSILVEGEYIEHTPRGQTHRKAGGWKLRRATSTHRIALIDGKPCTTFFLTGPKIREWGFHCPKGWIHWREFTAPDDSNITGKGCGGVTL